jgi:hypothetical protein
VKVLLDGTCFDDIVHEKLRIHRMREEGDNLVPGQDARSCPLLFQGGAVDVGHEPAIRQMRRHAGKNLREVRLTDHDRELPVWRQRGCSYAGERFVQSYGFGAIRRVSEDEIHVADVRKQILQGAMATSSLADSGTVVA